MDGLIANYTDDNIIRNRNADLAVLKRVARKDAVTTTRWFLENDMSANPN